MKILIILPLFLLAGCGNSQPGSSRAHIAPELPSSQIDPATGASISGRVLFSGRAPVMPLLDMAANPTCQRLNKRPRREEQVVVNPNGTLKNTYVWIKAGLPEARWKAPAEIATLTQSGCVYEPHVLGLMVGQTLEISNSDTVNHNVHAESTVNDAWSEMEAPRSEKKLKQFLKPEIMMPVSCGVHSWMKSYLNVSSHPFFFVTGEDGRFALKGVPPGTYTIEAVHERYGKTEAVVTVVTSQAKDVDFHYSAGASQ